MSTELTIDEQLQTVQAKLAGQSDNSDKNPRLMLDDIKKSTCEHTDKFKRFIRWIHLELDANPKVFDLRKKNRADPYSVDLPRVILLTSYSKGMVLYWPHRNMSSVRWNQNVCRRRKRVPRSILRPCKVSCSMAKASAIEDEGRLYFKVQ